MIVSGGKMYGRKPGAFDVEKLRVEILDHYEIRPEAWLKELMERGYSIQEIGHQLSNTCFNGKNGDARLQEILRAAARFVRR